MKLKYLLRILTHFSHNTQTVTSVPKFYIVLTLSCIGELCSYLLTNLQRKLYNYARRVCVTFICRHIIAKCIVTEHCVEINFGAAEKTSNIT
jgi:hypothetical protein